MQHALAIGDAVKFSKETLAGWLPRVKKLHARDRGVVYEVDGEHATVRWESTGRYDQILMMDSLAKARRCDVHPAVYESLNLTTL